MEDLLVNITTEGIILDVAGQATGTVSKTAAMMVEELIGLTR